MKKLIVLLVILTTSCGFFKKDPPEQLEEETILAPDIVDVDRDGKVEYTNVQPRRTIDGVVYENDTGSDSEDPTNEEPQVVECDVAREPVVSATTITNAIGTSGIKVVKNGSITFDLTEKEDKGFNVGFAEHADHIHLEKITMEATPTTLEIADYVIIKTEDNIPLVWFSDLSGHTGEPNFDGSLDLRPYVRSDNTIKFNYMAKGAAPAGKNTYRVRATFLAFYNCEEYD